MTDQTVQIPPIGRKELIGQLLLFSVMLAIVAWPLLPLGEETTSIKAPNNNLIGAVLPIAGVLAVTTSPLLILMFAIHLNRFKLLNAWFVALAIAIPAAFELFEFPRKMDTIWTYGVMGLILTTGCIFETLRRLWAS